MRARLGIPNRATVVGFVGRIVRDKGIEELITAWRRLREQFPDLHLAIAGKTEAHDPISNECVDTLQTDRGVHLVGFVADIANFYASVDIIVLPTYREGFPNVPLEAAAMALPVVATRVPGCVDAVEDEATGTLVSAADARDLKGLYQGMWRNLYFVTFMDKRVVNACFSIFSPKLSGRGCTATTLRS